MLLLLGGGDGFITLPDDEHLYPSYKAYMAQRTIIGDQKDPSDIRDYTIDWSGLLGQDSIALSQWRVPTGITAPSGSKTTTTSTVWVSGGTAGQDYYLINKVTTTDGRKFERFMVVPVRDL